MVKVSGNNLNGVADFATQYQENPTQVPQSIAVFAMINAIFCTKFFKTALLCYANFESKLFLARYRYDIYNYGDCSYINLYTSY